MIAVAATVAVAVVVAAVVALAVAVVVVVAVPAVTELAVLHEGVKSDRSLDTALLEV